MIKTFDQKLFKIPRNIYRKEFTQNSVQTVKKPAKFIAFFLQL